MKIFLISANKFFSVTIKFETVIIKIFKKYSEVGLSYKNNHLEKKSLLLM